jgi:hypothetical protein
LKQICCISAAKAVLLPSSPPAVGAITGSALQLGDREITVQDNQKNVITVPPAPESSESPAPVVGLSFIHKTRPPQL